MVENFILSVFIHSEVLEVANSDNGANFPPTAGMGCKNQGETFLPHYCVNFLTGVDLPNSDQLREAIKISNPGKSGIDTD